MLSFRWFVVWKGAASGIGANLNNEIFEI